MYSELLPYHNKIDHVHYDDAHTYANMIKHIAKFMKNTTSNGKRMITAKSLINEHELERFKEYKSISRIPWIARNQTEVDTLSGMLPVSLSLRYFHMFCKHGINIYVVSNWFLGSQGVAFFTEVI